jgi:uncharacterized protein
VALRESERVTAAADASFLIGLCLIEKLSLLREMVGRVCIAPAVWREVVEAGAGRPGAQQIAQALFLEHRSIQNPSEVEALKSFLGQGEAETLVMAEEMECDVVLVDDLAARRAAERRGLHPVGVLGFLLEAKRLGKIALIKPSVETLLANRFRLSEALIKKILREAGEGED